jgi:hypothetical protein
MLERKSDVTDMPIIYPATVYPYILSLRNQWFYAFSDRISLNTNKRIDE